MLRLFLLLCLLPVLAQADPSASRVIELRQQIPQPASGHPGIQLEWSNQAPQQRQALDNFYQNLQNLQLQQSMDRVQRQQRIEQLRGMSQQQRLQHFQNFVQDRGLNAPR
ncbi:hypothetical protein [Bacterioplanoides pacificum]|uniref:DUF3106 domain-containing protein n=1 Tax=Bacterioplanoides pacificum TaxID=1171596 RepID=A0ABV7VS98_9GAMM